MMGSPIYMSPEQIQSSKDVDQRGDIWALGIIMYELITGTAPFGGEHMAELIYQIISLPPPPIAARRPDVPPGLESVIFRCLTKDRNQRFASIAEFASALAPFAPRRALSSVERISGVMTGSYPANGAASEPLVQTRPEHVAGAGTAASWGQTAPGKNRGPWLLFGGAALAIALAAGVITARRFTSASAVVPEASALPTVAAKPPVGPPLTAEPPPVVVPAVTAASSAPMPSAAPLGASARPLTPPAVHGAAASPKPKPNLPAKPARASDPWGEGQH